jgi:hypothetical protein
MRAVKVTDKSTLKAWHAVPNAIYANDVNYIPHLRQDIDKLFNPKKNKLYREGGVAVRWTFYNDAGVAVGRVAAFVNPKSSKVEEQPTGGIGFFECINDQATANFIFETAKTFLKAEDMEAMDGPINFGERNQFWGCLCKNFTDPNSYGMNYNPPYYVELFENYGWQTYFEQYLYERDALMPPQPIFVRKYDQLTQHYKMELRNVKGLSVEQMAIDFRKVYNGAWGGHSNFKEMTARASLKIIESMKPVIDPHIVVFAFHNEEPVAFYVNIPELNEIFCYVNGNLNWWGKLIFLYHKWRGTPKTLVGIIFGVVKEWQGRGVEGAMIKFMGDYIQNKAKPPYTRTVLQWIGDFNPKMLKVADNLGGSRYRELKTYRYLFDRSKEFKRCPIVE